MSEHTKEPWAIDDTDSWLVLEGHEKGPMDEEFICLLENISNSDARRIVACVNACAGMEDPAATISTLKAQHDELLGALLTVQPFHEDPLFHDEWLSSHPGKRCPTCGLFVADWKAIRSAIANTEKGATE